MGYGFAGSVGWGKETSGGTPVTPTNFVEALSENLDDTYDRYDTVNIHNAYYEPRDERGVRRIGGPVVFAAHTVEVGDYLLGAMGAQAMTEILSGALYTTDHTMRTSDWDDRFPLQPWTFQMFRDVTSAQRFGGVNINTLDLSLAPNQDLRVNAGLIGVNATNVDEDAASYVGSAQSPFAFDTASMQLGGSVNANIEALNVSINNQLEGIPTLNNSTDIRKIRRTGPQIIRVGGTLEFDDISEYLNFVNDTEQQLVASVFRANSFSMVVDIPSFRYTAFPLGQSGRGRNLVQFEGRAEYNTGSSNAIKISLTTTNSFF